MRREMNHLSKMLNLKLFADPHNRFLAGLKQSMQQNRTIGSAIRYIGSAIMYIGSAIMYIGSTFRFYNLLSGFNDLL